MTASHRGYSLIEVLMAISLTSVTFTLAAIAMHSLFRIERQVRDAWLVERSLQRLAIQLRWDAHAARSAELVPQELVPQANRPAARGVVFHQVPGQSIDYVLEAHGIRRIERKGGAIQHQDVFRLPFPDSSCSLDKARERPLLTVHLIDKNRSAGAPAEWIIKAAVRIGPLPGPPETPRP